MRRRARSGCLVAEAAERELREETGLLAKPAAGVEVVEYVYPLTEEPADRRNQYDPSVAEVEVTCFHVTAPGEWAGQRLIGTFLARSYELRP